MLSQSSALFIRSVRGATLRADVVIRIVGKKKEHLTFIDWVSALGPFPWTRLRKGRKREACSVYALHNAICLPPTLQAKS